MVYTEVFQRLKGYFVLVDYHAIVVSSSPRPWIDVFALLKKFNMAVTENDLDPKVRKMSITF